MCNFSEGVYQKGRLEGKQEGIVEHTISSIKCIIEGTDFTIDQAMNLLRIPDSEKPKYLALLQQEN